MSAIYLIWESDNSGLYDGLYAHPLRPIKIDFTV